MKLADRDYFFGNVGEKIRVQEWGDENRPVILLIHGFPGCADHGRLLTSTGLRDSFRLIAMDRPGYGQSDPQKNLTPLKFAKQIEKLMDHLQISKFTVLSVSGGAPYAMAIAFLMRDRVIKLTSVAGVAPLTRRNFKFMNPQQKKAWALSKFVPNILLEFFLNKIWARGLQKLDNFLFTESHAFPTPDQKVFLHPEVGPALAISIYEALHNGPSGLLQDMKTYSNDWGFPLAKISCPVSLWHGGVDDVVHIEFAKDMHRLLPNADLNYQASEGHYSLPMNCRDEIILDLLNVSI